APAQAHLRRAAGEGRGAPGRGRDVTAVRPRSSDAAEAANPAHVDRHYRAKGPMIGVRVVRHTGTLAPGTTRITLVRDTVGVTKGARPFERERSPLPS